jgi:hypothetical protein
VKEERKDLQTFCKPLVKQLVEDIGGLNEPTWVGSFNKEEKWENAFVI